VLAVAVWRGDYAGEGPSVAVTRKGELVYSGERRIIWPFSTGVRNNIVGYKVNGRTKLDIRISCYAVSCIFGDRKKIKEAVKLQTIVYGNLSLFELAWCQVKGCVVKQDKTLKLREMHQVVVTSARWKNSGGHVIREDFGMWDLHGPRKSMYVRYFLQHWSSRDPQWRRRAAA
jgi:hypothetical protein